MIKYLIKKKVKKEVEDNKKKILLYTGAALAGAGVYFSYKTMKHYKNKKREEEESHYLNDSEYEIYNYDREDEELEEKVKEFNSKRINHENCPTVDRQEVDHYIQEAEQYKEDHEKKEIQLNDDDSEDDDKSNSDEYEKYDHYESDLSQDK